MSTAATDYEESLEELSREITNLEQALPGAMAQLFEDLSTWVPEFVLSPARNEVNTHLSRLPAQAESVRSFCNDECEKIYDVRSMTGAANAYRTLELEAIVALVDTLAEANPDWESPAKEMYTPRRLVAQLKTRDMRSAVSDMIRVFDDLDATTDSYFLSAVLLVVGIIAAVVGIILAIPTGGWGLIATVIGALITLAGWFTLPDMSKELESAQAQFTLLADDIKSGTWGERTNDAAWEW